MWTSSDVAHAFRVGVSSIKRWTDEGELEAVRTPGGHRRYTLPALYRFATIRNLPKEGLPPIDQSWLFEKLPPPADVTLFTALTRHDAETVRQLVIPPVDSLAQRAVFLDRVVGDSLREIGGWWERGELSVDQEHRATNMVIEAVDRLRPPNIRKDARLMTLACPPGEQHDLPLRLVRLLLEWAGWRTDLLGADVPWPAALHAVDQMHPAVLAFTSRNGEPFRATEFDDLVARCREQNVEVIVGGEWARGGPRADLPYLRFRTLRGFERWLRAA